MALFGSIATLRAQALPTPGFATAFAYVDELMRGDSAARQRLDAAAPGQSHKVELGGGVFAIEQVYETKPRAEGFFESHQRYIDVQVIVSGVELMEVVDAARIAIRDPYDVSRDLITYSDVEDASRLLVRAGEAAILYPPDVHMPSLRAGPAPALVRKSVVKVPVG